MVVGAIFEFFDDAHSYSIQLDDKTIELDCYQPLFSTDLICNETDNEIDDLLKRCAEVSEESRLLMEKSKIRKLPG